MSANTPDDFSWAFGNGTFDNFEDFLAKFTEYNLEIHGIEPPIEDFPLADSATVTLHFEGVPEGEEDYDDLSVQLTSRDGSPMTFLEFMFQANNALDQYLCDADHVFYEGLSPCDEDGGAAYWLMQGS